MKTTERREELNILASYLQEHGLKHSQQRETILQHFLDTGGHMTVDDLYRVIHRKHPGIGRTTIYRALKLFVDAQLASAIELKDGLTRFEHKYRHAHHDHMICTECGTILEVKDVQALLLSLHQANDCDISALIVHRETA